MNAQRTLVRPISHDDLPNCAALYKRVFSEAPWNEPWSTDRAQERLECFYQSHGFIGMLAEQDSVIGLALGNTEPFYCGNIFYLREMCVAPEFRQEGMGGELMSALEQELQHANVERVYLTTERAFPAATFYRRRGFQDIDSMGFYAKRLAR